MKDRHKLTRKRATEPIDLKNTSINLIGEAYNFLEPIKDQISLLAIGGSRAYGTDIETSDTDLRGILIDTENNILGIKDDFEQLEERKSDTVLFTMDKMFKLLSNSNPNVIELLGLREQDYLYRDNIAMHLINNKGLFLSKDAYYKFYGYAKGQLARLENALVNRANNGEISIVDAKKLLELRLVTKISDYERKYNSFKAEVYVENDQVDINYTFKELNNQKIKHILSELNDIKENLNKVGRRAGRVMGKGDEQISKHAMHLIRLYYICIDILEHREIITYRSVERELLLEIRKGSMQRPDGTFKNEFYTLMRNLELKLKKALDNSSLPDKPDQEKLNKLKIELNMLQLEKYGYNL